MYQLIRSVSAGQLFARQVPALCASIALSEVFFKFHSFTLECVAFLATWFILDAAVQGVTALTRGRRAGPAHPAA